MLLASEVLSSGDNAQYVSRQLPFPQKGKADFSATTELKLNLIN